MALKVAFSNFWPGFDPFSNFFLHVISLATTKTVEVVELENAQLVIRSCFPNIQVPSITKIRSKQINWFFTGENLRPLKNVYDLNLSFDLSKHSNSFRLPLWWLYLDWTLSPTSDHISDSRLNPYVLHLPRRLSKESTNNVSAFIGNMTKLRMETISSVPSSISFTGFGSAFNNPVDTKLKYRGQFDFNLCFENSYFPGYHTEKMVQAWAMESVPLYFGAKTVMLDFNRDCFINLSDFSTISNFWSHVASLTRKEQELIINSPLIKDPLTLKPLIALFRERLPV
jgi:hypothetical protein